MPATTRLALPYPAGTDGADVVADMQALAEALDASGQFLTGTDAALPAHATVKVGTFYWASDSGIMYVKASNNWNALWRTSNQPGSVRASGVLFPFPIVASADPGSPTFIHDFGALTWVTAQNCVVELDFGSVIWGAGSVAAPQVGVALFDGATFVSQMGTIYRDHAGPDQQGSIFKLTVSATAGSHQYKIAAHRLGDIASCTIGGTFVQAGQPTKAPRATLWNA